MQLNAPTIAIVVIASFIAQFVAWSYVARNYPDLRAARFWRDSTLAAAVAAATLLLRGVMDPLLPILAGNTLMIIACCLTWAGVRQFYDRSVPWRFSVAATAAVLVLLTVFKVIDDNITVRVVVMSSVEFTILAMIVKDLRRRGDALPSPGANLARLMIVAMMIADGLRGVCALAGIGGPISPVSFNGAQMLGFLVLLFTSMMVNFGYVLMAIDRLRGEVAALAMVDDLTGIANRRQFLARLDEACARAAQHGEPLALLVIDLDGFKAINDGHGHGAGDACLRAFTHAAQARLRASDVFARTGGDEFCVILRTTTLDEAALVARDLVKTCRKTRAHWHGEQIAVTASVGVAAWSREIGLNAEALITAADQALYAAKRQGRDRLALPEADPLPMTA